MDKGNATGIAGTVIGLAATVCSVAAAFLFPDVAPSIWRFLFWSGLFVVLCSGLFLFDIHWLGNKRKITRVSFPIILVLGYGALFVFAGSNKYTTQPQSFAGSNNSAQKPSYDIRKQFIGPLERFYFDGVSIRSKIVASKAQYSETQINNMWVWQVNVFDWVCNNMGEYALAKLSNFPNDLTPSNIGSDANAKAAAAMMVVLLNNLNEIISNDSWDPHGNPQLPPSGCEKYVGKATDAPFTGAP